MRALISSLHLTSMTAYTVPRRHMYVDRKKRTSSCEEPAQRHQSQHPHPVNQVRLPHPILRRISLVGGILTDDWVVYLRRSLRREWAGVPNGVSSIAPRLCGGVVEPSPMQASALVHLEGCRIESPRVQTECKASLQARFSVTDKLHRVVISHALAATCQADR